MERKPNNYASQMLYVIMLAGCLSGGFTMGEAWLKGKGRWTDLPCVALWPACIAFNEVPVYLERRWAK